ncbi:uncharacterized protein KY384_003523 [Bacidia gigantensis]|uniref:uncharacterized protein n=1 Tax=Bacidia gigantensis TaxID=2732470 RepID=UPI001D052DDD|nr:uncharacterized protein KY384_003523 [Bacidia gigantensis]KAG8531887.1 hypothetical protein KY384_003523 [Bacidia gigantensis]
MACLESSLEKSGIKSTATNIHNESVEILYAESSFCIPYKLIDTLSARTGPPLTWKNVKKMRILTISIEARMRNTNGVHAYPAPFNELDERYIVPLFDFLAKGDTAVQTLTLEMEDCTPDFLTCVIYARDLFEWLEPHVQKFVKIPELVIAFHTDAYPNERWAWIKAFDFNPPAKGFLDTHGAGTWRSMWSLQYDCLMIGLAEALRDEFGPIEAEDQSEDDWRYSRRMKFRPADHSRTELGDVVEEQ